MSPPLPYKVAADFEAVTSMYRDLAVSRSLAFDSDSEWRLDGPVGTQFIECEPHAAQMVMDSYSHLLERYNLFEDERHEMGLAVIRLQTAR